MIDNLAIAYALLDDLSESPRFQADLLEEALSQAYSRGLEDAANATAKLRYLPSQGIDHEMQMYNDGLEDAVSAIRALGSK